MKGGNLMRIRSMMKAAVAALVATPIAGAQSNASDAVDDFFAGSLVRALGSSAISDRARLAEMQLAQSGTPKIQGPSGNQALSIAVCSLNECSDVACEGAPKVGSPTSPQPQALSIDCSRRGWCHAGRRSRRP